MQFKTDKKKKNQLPNYSVQRTFWKSMGIVISDIPLPKLTSPKASVLRKSQNW